MKQEEQELIDIDSVRTIIQTFVLDVRQSIIQYFQKA
jgi:hypothetical protein